MISIFFGDKRILPQIHELQIIVNKLKVLKIELPEAFQVGAIVAILPPTWKSYRKRIFHKNEDYSLEEIQKHIRIEEESICRDKLVEGSNGETSKANAVSQPKHHKNKVKKGNEKPLGPKTNPNKFKGEKGPCFVCGKNGHYAIACRHRKDQQGPKVNATQRENIFVTLSEVNAVQGKVKGWWYDTCATVHVTYYKSLFKTFEESNGQ